LRGFPVSDRRQIARFTGFFAAFSVGYPFEGISDFPIDDRSPVLPGFLPLFRSVARFTGFPVYRFSRPVSPFWGDFRCFAFYSWTLLGPG
jgi:hypothetical protein